jgi:hypothetical protein
VLAALLGAAALSGAGVAAGQVALPTLESYLRLDWEAEPAKGGRQRISGYAYNDRDYWATKVQIRADALDASGQVVGTATTAIYGAVPPRNRSYFSVDVSPAGASYRVTVQSVDWRSYGGGGM